MASHPIVHLEIPAHDVEAAGKFYAEVFGWKLDLDQMYNYLQFQSEGGPSGAFVQVSEAMESGHPGYQPGKIMVYIADDNMESTLAKIESLGGKVLMPKTEIPHVGWFGIFADPTGNHVALFRSMSGQG